MSKIERLAGVPGKPEVEMLYGNEWYVVQLTARPIIFSAPMIRALLDGKKTQTRRIVKPQPEWMQTDALGSVATIGRSTGMAEALCPYGRAGDLLWVREVWALCGSLANVRPKDFEFPHIVLRDGLRYQSDDDGYDGTVQYWRPSIHMPRWASRLTLRLTDVRIERLQEISEADAQAEGITGPHYVGYQAYFLPGDSKPRYSCATAAFECLWESLHGPDSWSANPWVWALTFDVIRRNVDEVVDDD